VNVWTFCLLHNEAPLLPYFLRHYAPLSERVILYDDHSSDGGPSLAQAYANVTVRPYPGGGLDDLAFVEFAGQAYREARGQADWIIWVDADEFVYHPALRSVLAGYTFQGFTLARTLGYAMWAERFPSGAGQIYDEIKSGVVDPHYAKPVILNPAVDIAWHAGKHGLLSGAETVRESPAEIKLLHYRHLGQAYYDGRNARNYGRMSAANIARGHGFQTYPQNQAENGWGGQLKHFANPEQVL